MKRIAQRNFFLPGTMTIVASVGLAASVTQNAAALCDSAMCLVHDYVNPAIALLSALVGVATVVGIIWGAIMYVQSGGDPGQAAAGKKKITNALIGLLAYIFLYAFLQFILPGGTFNG